LQKNSLLEKIENQSLAIRTPVLLNVKNTIDSIKPNYDSVKKFKTNIIDWLKPVIDLTGYHVYPRNGITEGLDWWYNRETRGVNMRDGDYQWILPKEGVGKIAYISLPSAIDGDIDLGLARPNIGKNLCPIALDLAYVGSTRVTKIDIKPEFAFYSLSKSFGVRNIRTGWIFTKKPDKKLEALTDSAKYYNYYAQAVAEEIISNYDIDYIHKKLYKKQKDLCKLLEFKPSDSVWLATTKHPRFKKFKRGSSNRICLAGVINEKT